MLFLDILLEIYTKRRKEHLKRYIFEWKAISKMIVLLTKIIIRSFTFIHSSEMEEYSARPQTKICRSAIREYSLIKQTEINFESIPSITFVKEM